MTQRAFLDVFENIKLPAAVSQYFQDTFVTDIQFLKKEKNIALALTGQIDDNNLIEQLKSALIQNFPGLHNVIISVETDLSDCPPKQYVSAVKERSVTRIRREHPMFGAVLSSSKWQINGDQLEIHMPGSSPYLYVKKSVDKTIETVSMQCGKPLHVVFKTADLPKALKTPAPVQSSGVQAAPVKAAVKPPQVRKRVQTANPSAMLLGKKIAGEVSFISEAQNEGEMPIIQGDVLNFTARELKSGKMLVAFDLTDGTDAITVKYFASAEQYEAAVPEIRKGSRLRVKGVLQFDRFSKEINLMAKAIEKCPSLPKKMDDATEKRVELHLHTQMSQMDAVTSVGDYVARAALWGHQAIALTDHGCVQAYPDAYSAAKKHGVKLLYGVEAYLVDNLGSIVQSPKQQTLNDTFVVFDIETTGLNKDKCSIIEIGAVRVTNGAITETFSSFCNPGEAVPYNISKLTGITDDMLQGAPTPKDAVAAFLQFAGDAVLVAHNASFDVGFIRVRADKDGLALDNTVLDTLELSRMLYPELSKHKLDVVCKHLEISLENHHRACDDAAATAQILLHCFKDLQAQSIHTLTEINILSAKNHNYKKAKAYHAVVFAKNQAGLENLYKLVTDSHINYFFRRPRILKSELLKYREGLILGSACEAGELFRYIMDGRPEQFIEETASFYDYLEVQPLGNNQFLLDSGRLSSRDDLIAINQKIIALGEKLNKPVVATGDCHFLDPEDEIFRRIIMKGDGFADADHQPPLYYRTTQEMLTEFNYLPPQKAYELVVTNTNTVAGWIEDIKPIPDETFPPEIPGAEEELRSGAMETAIRMYGDPLPHAVLTRLERELDSIIKNGFSVMYIIAKKLVLKSNEDGYLVGSRGSVGSSFAATMAGITEVNPLPPHYLCTECKYSDFDSDSVKSFGGGSGSDMPDKKCPNCGANLIKDGHDIPFETFLGFDGDKEPDIDLNFSGEYQQRSHAYTEELFGAGNVFKAGTIGTLAEKTAYGYVKKYYDEKGIVKSNAEINRLVAGCTGVKRTTGQHPGGLMIVPKNQDIHKFTPVQHPANDMNSSITTTHFDYHSISGRLLKLDLLGHDDPTVIRMLHDLTGINPQHVPLDDAATMSLFTSTQALGVSAAQIGSETGSLGIPEFGTKFVRQMLKDTKPTSFGDLVRISGLSHGTDVWLNNAQELIRSKMATLKEVISTRDDIMLYLIRMGMDKKHSFKIMENVRKGKGLSSEDEVAMHAANVPDWYIESCKKIKYMFPKAHAAAYVMMAFRIAYFKVHHPQAFYATYFTVRADDFDYETMCRGMGPLMACIAEHEEKGNTLTAKEKNKLTIAEVVREMIAREISFVPIDLYASDASKFQLTTKGLMPPLNSVQGLGVTAAESIVSARADGEFTSIEDLRIRTSLSKTVIELLKQNGILGDMPETSQLSLF